jgi:phospholipase/lecithinase/hemolysin
MLMKKRRVAVMAWVLVVLLFPLQTSAASYDNIVTFGDSLTDTGNILAVSPFAYDTQHYSGGGFSNGPVWVDHLLDRLDFDGIYLIANALAGGWAPPQGKNIYNTAFGGAETGTLETPPGFVTQVGIWAQNQLPLPENCLCVVWIGGNDFLNWITDHQVIQDDPTETVATTVTNIITGLTMLVKPEYGLNATDILVITLPDLGKTPANNGSYGPDNSEFATEVTVAFNSALKTALNAFATDNPTLNLITFDVNDLFLKMVAYPANFGFDNTTQAAFYETAATHGFENVGRYAFWDGIHPSTEAHKVIADQIYGHLVQPPDDPQAIFIEVNNGAEQLVGLTSSQPDLVFNSIMPGSDEDTTSATNRPNTFHYGLFEFNMTVPDGGNGTVTLYLPEAAPADAKWYISTADGWIDFTRSTLNDPFGDGAEFSSDRKRVTLYLTDNGNYDLDDVLGSIKDPSGLATMVTGGSGGSSGGTCFIGSALLDSDPGVNLIAWLLVVSGFGLWMARTPKR